MELRAGEFRRPARIPEHPRQVRAQLYPGAPVHFATRRSGAGCRTRQLLDAHSGSRRRTRSSSLLRSIGAIATSKIFPEGSRECARSATETPTLDLPGEAPNEYTDDRRQFRKAENAYLHGA